MESFLDRNMSGSNYSSPLITDDILSILENDPFWRDLEMNGGLMNEPFDLSQCLESENGTNDLDLVLENDLSFSKTQTMDFTNNELPPIEHPDTDSASHYSESSHSPRSSSSGSDNAESSVVIQPFTPEYSDHDLYSVPQVYCDNSNSNSPQTAIDIGADVVVVTSEYSPLDESSHTIVTLPPQQIIKSSAKAGREGKKRKVEDDDDLSFFGTISQDLNLTEDEVKLMKKEGLNIPNHLPLTKAEEKELKRIRRKIRNKHSAQESRKRKKEYVDGLENRVKVCTSENVRLQKKVQLLENQQKSLLDQIKSLQAMISGSSAKPAPTSTCLLVLFASLLLFLLPSLFPSTTYEPKSLVSNGKSSDVTPGASRVLLSAKEVDSGQLEKGIAEDLINKSNEQYVTTVKSEFPQDSYGEPFHSYPTIAELTSHQYNPSKDYTWHSPGYQRDEAGFIVQNESKYFDAGDSPRVKRKLMLQ